MLPVKNATRAPRTLGLALLRAAIAAATAALLLTSALFGGRVYLWCAPMRQAMERCCCEIPPDPAAVADPGQQELRRSCCEARSLDVLPEASAGAAAHDVPPPAVLVELATLAPLAEPPRREALRAWAPPRASRKDPIRAGPDRPSEGCALLQVFRC